MWFIHLSICSSRVFRVFSFCFFYWSTPFLVFSREKADVITQSFLLLSLLYYRSLKLFVSMLLFCYWLCTCMERHSCLMWLLHKKMALYYMMMWLFHVKMVVYFYEDSALLYKDGAFLFLKTESNSYYLENFEFIASL